MTDHDKRVYHHMYETNEGIAEHAERIAKLEELVRDMWRFTGTACSKCVAKNDGYCGIGIDEGCPLEHSIYDRMRELGVEVE